MWVFDKSNLELGHATKSNISGDAISNIIEGVASSLESDF